mmetsp:Transcript_43269/g.86831  ORF Transcript_43269/g.86831 Transcript_43269/m.86831 type:complete len:128 (-) Transcript_43269:3650-4033(-)
MSSSKCSRKIKKLSIKFRRPKTNILKRNPKYKKKLLFSRISKPFFKHIRNPVTTEAAMKKIQAGNTLVFMIDSNLNKKGVKFTLNKLYRTRIIKINTLITPLGEKKAYVKLSPDSDALDVANKIGFI